MKVLLNSDVGEGAGYDHVIIPLVQEANICCGAHAGGADAMREAVSLAVRHEVRIGAHPGYPDRSNFGRVPMTLSESELRSTIQEQLEQLDQVLQAEGAVLSYCKPHGALYNAMSSDFGYAQLVSQMILEWRSLPIMGLANSEAERAVKSLGGTFIREGFLDRAYTDEGLLVPRSQEGAVITERVVAQRQAEAFLQKKPISTITGKQIQLEVDSLCVHGDTAGAVDFLKSILH